MDSPGIIQAADATDRCVLVKAVSGIGCNGFFWPMRDDTIWYEPDNVLGLIPEPTPATKRHVQSVLVCSCCQRADKKLLQSFDD